MCELLTVVDTQIIQVALNGLENILKAGNLDKTKQNPYAMIVEECYGNCFFFLIIFEYSVTAPILAIFNIISFHVM